MKRLAGSEQRQAAPRERDLLLTPGDDRGAQHAPAVTRAIKILRLLAKSDAPLGGSAIARTLDLVPSTCLHILRALVDEGIVAVNPETKRYTLDAGILTLAGSLLQEESFYRALQPTIDGIAHTFDMTTIALQPLARKHLVVVAISRTERALRLHVDIGSRFPLLISASGRCVAAFGSYSPAELERAFTALRWDDAPSFKVWKRQVEETRRQGYGVDIGNYINGVTIVAAPVLDPTGRIPHILVALGIGEQIERIGISTLGEALREAATDISQHFSPRQEEERS
ncbi:IclR family transcriptional regulator [bacterium]|nr:MAG: IclR family transcriptional regulator [bacterium]